MYIRTAADIGNMIKAYRLQAKLSQTELAQRVGTTQDWISEAERGKPTAELGLVLRTLVALGALLEIPPPGLIHPSRSEEQDLLEDYPDIDAIVAGHKGGRDE